MDKRDIRLGGFWAVGVFVAGVAGACVSGAGVAGACVFVAGVTGACVFGGGVAGDFVAVLM